MSEQPLESENFLDSEGGMFQMEITNTIHEAEEAIEISDVDDVKKVKVREILKNLVIDAGKKRNEDPYDTARYAIEQLLSTLNTKDAAENNLFVTVRDVILKARSSAKGWEWPPKNYK
jgi:hypothetical protein